MADAEGNSYGPYDIEIPGSEAEAFTEANWAKVNRRSQVWAGGALTFSGLTAQLAAIDLQVRGFWLSRDTAWTDATPAQAGASPRRDLIVARRQLTSGEGAGAIPGETFLTVLRGAPAASPVDPAFDPVDDYPLWSFQVPAASGTVITAARDYRRPKCVLSKTSGLSVSSGVGWTRVTGWTQDRRHPFLTVNGDGTVTFSRDGIIRATARASSDDTTSGWSGVHCALPSGVNDFADGYAEDVRGRSSGFAGAGLLRQPLSWAGRVDAGQTTAVDVQQVSSDGGTVAYQVYLSLEYTELY